MDKINNDKEFDVNSWIKLYQECPDTFDKKRAEIIERTIADAPEEFQQRLRGLQFQIDGIRRTSSNPMSACIAISRKMFDQLGHLKDVVEGKTEVLKKNKQEKAKILNFELNTVED